MESGHCIHLFIIRHGVTQWNLEKRYLGHTDIPLNQNHLKELNELKDWLLNNVTLDAIITSDLSRCIETAKYVWPETPLITDSRIREMHFGDWEGLTYNDLKDDSLYQNWLDDWETIAPPNGETGKEFTKRIHLFWDEILSSKLYSSVGIVTHGGVIRRMISSLVSDISFWNVEIPHGKGYHLQLEKAGGEWTCSSLSVVPSQEKEIL